MNRQACVVLPLLLSSCSCLHLENNSIKYAIIIFGTDERQVGMSTLQRGASTLSFYERVFFGDSLSHSPSLPSHHRHHLLSKTIHKSPLRSPICLCVSYKSIFILLFTFFCSLSCFRVLGGGGKETTIINYQ